MSDKTAPFLIVASGQNSATGGFAVMHGIVFARSQAEALGMALNEYRGRNRAVDGFDQRPRTEAAPVSDEACSAIYEFVAAKRKDRKR